MIPELRRRFNDAFTAERHERFLAAIADATGVRPEFRLCETPIFIPLGLRDRLESAALEIAAQLDTPEYRQRSEAAVPDAFRVPNDPADQSPLFAQIDFAICDDGSGGLTPKLIELQAFPSLYGFQFTLGRTLRQAYPEFTDGLDDLGRGLTPESYVSLLRDAIVAGHDPAEVVLLEIDPEHQKTRPDFAATDHLLGIPTVDVRLVIRHGKRLFHRSADGREQPISRIYNRVIVDEWVRRDIRSEFSFGDELDVEWAGHPNGYFRWSKFSLPFLDHPAAPRATFLSELADVPSDLDQFVLKPLFSFSGLGVKVDVTPADLAAIPEAERSGYLLQEKIEYAPALATPDGPAKVEIRMMMLHTAAGYRHVAYLTRISKGAMMGVDFNHDRSWVGSSTGFAER